MGVPITNQMITAAKLGNSNITRIYLGNDIAWPIARQATFEFDTTIREGTIDFTVTADTPWIACLINDVDMFLVERVGSSISRIRASMPDEWVTYGKGEFLVAGFSQTFSLGGTNYKIPVKIPLYRKDIVSIRGYNSRSTKYNADLNKGSIAVEVNLGVTQSGRYQVSCTGASTQTKNVNGVSIFTFKSLSRGTKTITIKDLDENITKTTTMVIDGSSKALAPKSITLTTRSTLSDVTDSNNLTNIKLYALTDAEAQTNLQNAYGNEASISITCDIWQNGSDYQVHHNYFKINHGGSGYGANKTIPVLIRDVYTYQSFFKGSSYAYHYFNLFNMYTDSNGTIYKIGKGSNGNMTTGSATPENQTKHYVRNTSNISSYNSLDYMTVYSSIPYDGMTSSYGWAFNILGRDPNGGYNTNNFWRQFPGGWWRAGELLNYNNGSKADNLAWDWWYAAVTDKAWYQRQKDTGWRSRFDYTPTGNDAVSIIQEAVENNKFITVGNSKPIQMRFENTGTSVFSNTGQFFENLVFNNEDNSGNIKSVDLGNTPVERVKAVRQKQLKLLSCEGFQMTGMSYEDHLDFIGDAYMTNDVGGTPGDGGMMFGE